MQKYYIHVVAGLERVIDREGGFFVGLSDAITEARESAIELAYEELRSGRKFPRDWRTQVVDSNENVCATVFFDDLLGHCQLPMPNGYSAILEKVNLVATKVERNSQEVREGLAEAWLHLSRLKALSAKFPVTWPPTSGS